MEAAQLSRNEKTMRRGKGKKKVREPCNPKKKKRQGKRKRRKEELGGERDTADSRERELDKYRRAETTLRTCYGVPVYQRLVVQDCRTGQCTKLPSRPVPALKGSGHAIRYGGPPEIAHSLRGPFPLSMRGGRPSVTRQFPIWSVIPLFPSILNHRGSIFTGRDPSLQEGRTKSSSVWRVQTDALVPRRSALAIPLVEGQL